VSAQCRVTGPRRRVAARLGGVALAMAALSCGGYEPTYVPRDATLREQPLYFYPAARAERRGFVLFFGNDVAFWEPHRELAHRLSAKGYDVVGLDLVPYLAALPDGAGIRDTAFAHAISELITRSRAELGADTLPVVLAGHSFGAEVAFWVAQEVPPSRLAGILAMNPRPAGHLYVDIGDRANLIASGPRSFSTVELSHSLPANIRIALVRSGRDHFIRHDSAFVASGGERLHRYVVPFARHSLKGLIVAGPMIERAMEYVVGGGREEEAVLRGSSEQAAGNRNGPGRRDLDPWSSTLLPALCFLLPV